MSELRIERVIVDFYNNTGVNANATSLHNSYDKIVERADDYDTIVEFASIDLSNMALDLEPDYEIMILNDEGGKSGNRFPELPNFDNYFKISGPLQNVSQMDSWFYDLMHKKTLPLSLGNLSLTDKGYFRRSVTQEEYTQSFANGLFKVYVNAGLKELMPELVSQTSERVLGREWFELHSNVGDTTQQADTLFQLLKASSIRFYSSLPTNSSRVQNRARNEIIKEQILTTIAINNQTTDIMSKTSKRYEPSAFRRTSLVNDQPIQNFIISAFIYYHNSGRSELHTLRPGDYMNLQIAFVPKNQTYSPA